MRSMRVKYQTKQLTKQLFVQFPELVAASYGENSTSDVDPDGVALIWNTKFSKETPEYIFQCQSRVTKAKFAK